MRTQTTGLSGNITTTTGTLKIGYASQIQYFNGLIDEVKIWNYARSGEDIKNDYAKGLARLQ